MADRRDELLRLAQELAQGAAALHRAGRRQILRVETKSTPTDMVSQIDRETEAYLIDRLFAARPNDSLLAEEGGSREGGSGVRWIIDPLDGTTNYVYGYQAYAVSIAAEIDGEPALGVVLESSADHLFSALRGGGATCDGEPLQTSGGDQLATALVATGFSYDAATRAHQGEVAGRLLSHIRDLRRGGSAALDLCRLAAGQVDAYWELALAPWDYAAGRVIAAEAGATVLEIDVGHRRGPLVVAAPPALLPAFRQALDDAGAFSHEWGPDEPL